MPAFQYEIRGIKNCRTPAMVHFKNFLELMDLEDMQDGYSNLQVVTVAFVPSDGSEDAHLADAYGCPLDAVVPLFVATDQGFGGFSNLYGVFKAGGGVWDSEADHA